MALADPSDNPWIESALDGTLQLLGMAIGHYEVAPEQLPAARPSATPRLGPIRSFALTTTQQVLATVIAALLLAALAFWLQPFGIPIR